MITTINHAAAFVLPAFAAAAAGMAAVRAFALRQKSVAVKAVVTTDRTWTGSGLRTYGTSFDPQSRGSSG
ncbi:MAG TPA: hypothetical protein VFL59_01345 [Candidatus Nanopelagicales bacterium]|nr:hypothetical protein [Candidatus Nanopelagicales bacterium]